MMPLNINVNGFALSSSVPQIQQRYPQVYPKNARLTPIAPKNPRAPRSMSLSNVENRSPPGTQPKNRLPPRSRTGCWTCRTRKVKCDERHPKCGQCLRLQHSCDYSPRLSFRDDTYRVMERMQDVSTAGSIVWDPKAPYDIRSRQSLQPLADNQTLPRFADLTNDEDRELKAIGKKPGTYNLICNPKSFTNLLESEEEDGSYLLSPTKSSPRIKPEPQSEKEGVFWNPKFEFTDSSEDPEIVILRRFEDCNIRRISSASTVNSRIKASNSPTPSGISGSASATSEDTKPSWTVSEKDEFKYVDHYQRYISHHVMQIHNGIPCTTEDLLHGGDAFERESANFSPLFHAMMALSALSCGCRDGNWSIDALQHYQQALPTLQLNLRSPADLCSDGTLFTHLFLLIYEIAAAEQWRECLWQQHLTQLLRIILTRADFYGKERHPCIVWFLVTIDTYAALTAGGNGELAATLLEHGLIPDASDMMPPKFSGMVKREVSDDEINTLTVFLKFNQKIVLLAARLGKLSKTIRFSATASYPYLDLTEVETLQNQVTDVLAKMKSIWHYESPNFVESIFDNGNDSPMLVGVQDLFEHAFALYHACLLYAYTSIWPSQMIHPTEKEDQEIDLSIRQIMARSAIVMARERMDFRFLVFPLFIAGFASRALTDKIHIVNMLSLLETESIGRNTKVIREILQAVYELQSKAVSNGGTVYDIDWQNIMVEKGYQVVNFGL